VGIVGGKLLCDMAPYCLGEVTHIDEKGYIYCAPHGAQRKSYKRCRKLTKTEMRKLVNGEPFAY
jgi:hypothetical protein